jgi:hypothetical protein
MVAWRWWQVWTGVLRLGAHPNQALCAVFGPVSCRFTCVSPPPPPPQPTPVLRPPSPSARTAAASAVAVPAPWVLAGRARDTPWPQRAYAHWLRLRAWTLHCLAPHDKSVWACSRLRSWWLLQGVGFIPTFNHVWWFLVLCMKDKGDEYQVRVGSRAVHPARCTLCACERGVHVGVGARVCVRWRGRAWLQRLCQRACRAGAL